MLLSSQLGPPSYIRRKEAPTWYWREERGGQAGEGREESCRGESSETSCQKDAVVGLGCLEGGRQPRKQRRTYLKLVALRSHGSGISPPIRLSRRGLFIVPFPSLPFIFFAVFAPPFPRYLLRMLRQPLGPLLLQRQTAQDPTPSCSVIEPSFSPSTSFGRYKTHYRAPGKERTTHELLQPPPPQPRRPIDAHLPRRARP